MRGQCAQVHRDAIGFWPGDRRTIRRSASHPALGGCGLSVVGRHGEDGLLEILLGSAALRCVLRPLLRWL
jgi:hypothetical protein